MLKGDIHGKDCFLEVCDFFEEITSRPFCQMTLCNHQPISLSMVGWYWIWYNVSLSKWPRFVQCFFSIICFSHHIHVFFEFTWINFYTQIISAISERHFCRGFETWVVAILGESRLLDVVSRFFELLGRSIVAGWVRILPYQGHFLLTMNHHGVDWCQYTTPITVPSCSTLVSRI